MRKSSISRRLLGAFAVLVVCFAASGYAAYESQVQMHSLLHEMREDEETTRLLVELRHALRDAQTATGADEQARAREFQTLLGELRPKMNTAAQAQLIEQIAALAGDDQAFHLEPGQTQQIEQRVDELRREFAASAGGFEQHANILHHSTFRWLVAVLAVASSFAVGVALYIGRTITARVNQLSSGARSWAEGNLNARVSVPGDDEFGRLALQFNAMAAALKETQDARAHAERLAGIGQVAAGVAHEINNPLAVILGYVRILRRGAQGPLETDLGVIEEEAVRCQQIVESLLELARPGNPSPQTTPVSIGALCREIAERLRASEQTANVHLTVEGDELVPGSELKLRQLFLNLIRNAVEAARPDGNVTVSLSRSGNFVEASIVDTGTGVPPQILPHLFEPFATSKPAGTGLGLALARSIARDHRGDVTLVQSSTAGTTFKVALPHTAEARE